MLTWATRWTVGYSPDGGFMKRRIGGDARQGRFRQMSLRTSSAANRWTTVYIPWCFRGGLSYRWRLWRHECGVWCHRSGQLRKLKVERCWPKRRNPQRKLCRGGGEDYGHKNQVSFRVIYDRHVGRDCLCLHHASTSSKWHDLGWANCSTHSLNFLICNNVGWVSLTLGNCCEG